VIVRATPLLLAIFSGAAAVVLLISAVTLIAPGGPLDVIWRVAEDKHTTLLPYRHAVWPAFLVLAAAAAAASVGCYRRRRWGWWMVVAGLVANGVGDALQIFVGRPMEGIFGVVIAALLLVWLTRGSVRDQFSLASPAVS
jgi:hypothetical protein